MPRPAPPKNDDLYLVESWALRKIKIGRTDRGIDARFRELVAGSPDSDLRVLAVVEGAGDAESLAHRAFADFWSHSEWFRDCWPIREWIKRGCVIDELYPRIVALEVDGFDFDGWQSLQIAESEQREISPRA